MSNKVTIELDREKVERIADDLEFAHEKLVNGDYKHFGPDYLRAALAALSPSEDTTDPADEGLAKYDERANREASEGSGAPLPEAAKAKYPPAERLVESLHWAISFIEDAEKRRWPLFDGSNWPSGEMSEDWSAWASAKDWLKDAELAAQPLPEGEKCERPGVGHTCFVCAVHGHLPPWPEADCPRCAEDLPAGLSDGPDA